MNLRYRIDEDGQIFLEKEIKSVIPFSDKQVNVFWEKIPVVSEEGIFSSENLPIGQSPSMFFFSSLGPRRGEDIPTLLIDVKSALAIKSFSEINDNVTRIDFKDNYFLININILMFLKIVTDMLSKFMIIEIDQHGNISRGKYAKGKTKTKVSKKDSEKTNSKKGEQNVTRVRNSK